MESKAKKPFIVAWNNRRLQLSDGDEQKEFYNHEEALAFLEDEMSKVKFEKSSSNARMKFKEQYGVEPAQVQLQCSRETKGVVLLYGVSLVYILPPDFEHKLNFV